MRCPEHFRKHPAGRRHPRQAHQSTGVKPCLPKSHPNACYTCDQHMSAGTAPPAPADPTIHPLTAVSSALFCNHIYCSLLLGSSSAGLLDTSQLLHPVLPLLLTLGRTRVALTQAVLLTKPMPECQMRATFSAAAKGRRPPATNRNGRRKWRTALTRKSRYFGSVFLA